MMERIRGDGGILVSVGEQIDVSDGRRSARVRGVVVARVVRAGHITGQQGTKAQRVTGRGCRMTNAVKGRAPVLG